MDPLDLPSAAIVMRDFEPYLRFFYDVPREAWTMAMVETPTWIDTTTRKNAAWDAMCVLARQKAPEFGLTLTYKRQGRPLPLVLVNGDYYHYAVRFNNLSDTLQAGGWHTVQRQMFEGQSLAVQRTLPGIAPLIYLRAGYVLDELGIAVVRTPIVLPYNDAPVWAFDIEEPRAAPATIIPLPQPKTPQPSTPAVGRGEEHAGTGTNEDS